MGGIASSNKGKQAALKIEVRIFLAELTAQLRPPFFSKAERRIMHVVGFFGSAHSAKGLTGRFVFRGQV
jgi:hypothetical protein